MSFKKGGLWLFMVLSISLPEVGGTALAAKGNLVQPVVNQPLSPSPDLPQITAEELKRKVEKNEPVTIIDVRSTNNYIDSGNKIKGAIHIKLRRLRSRLTVPPLKSVPRDREIITYCACPNDQASIEAAQVLLAAGFKRVRILKGGWRVWLKANGPVEPKPSGI